MGWLCVGITIPRSLERGNDIGEGEWMKESRFGVAATAVIGAGVLGKEVPEGSKLNSRRENCD